MRQWVFDRLEGDELDFAHDIILFHKLTKGRGISAGHQFYESGAKRKYWTRGTKNIYIAVFRNGATNSVSYELQNSRSTVLTLFIKGNDYKNIVKG